MTPWPLFLTRSCSACLFFITALLGACNKDESPAQAAPPPPQAANGGATGTSLQATSQQWSPEAMEELLAPIALYPDTVLYQILIAATNPQEVLDAGNWLIANPNLEGKALDEAAAAIGFTPPIRALIQFPQEVDNMCINLDWTEELGQAYINDQAGVQGAVQRLRQQAESVGNLESSDYMEVTNETQEGQQTVIIQPADPEVIYVPQYDPNAAYAPQSYNTASTVPTTYPTTYPTTTADEGFSTGEMVAVGLFAFGAGVIVNEIRNDNKYNNNYGWHQPAPYYPPYPYQPRYGGGFHPQHNYNRPNNYVRNNTVIINQNNNYYNRFNKKGGYNKRAPARSPITAARPKRNDLVHTATPTRQTRPASAGPAVKGSYAGGRQDSSGRKVQGNYAGGAAATRSDAGGRAGNDGRKTQGSYAGGNDRAAANRASTNAGRPAATNETRQTKKSDRGYNAANAKHATKSTTKPAPTSSHRNTAFGGAGNGKDARAASERGRKSVKSEHRNAEQRGERR